MKKLLSSLAVGTAVGTLGLAGCSDNAPPAGPTPSPAARESAAAPESGAPAVDPLQEKLGVIVRNQDAFARARELSTLLPTLGAEAVPAVKATLADLRVDLKAIELDLLVRFWAAHEPEAAARWAKANAPLNYKNVAVFAAVSTWAQKDPDGAVAIALPWDEIVGLESIIPISIVRGWYARGNPPELQKFLRGLPLDIRGQRAIAAYIRTMIETQGSDATKLWAESLPSVGDDGGYKQIVFSRTVDILSQLDVKAAIAWCEIHCYGPYGKNMRDVISRNWALYDGPASMTWLGTTRPGTERDLGLRLTYALWTRQDLAGAVAWMDEQVKNGGPPDWLRPAIPDYAKVLASSRPLEAIEWAKRTPNPVEAEYVLIGVVRVWRHTDPAAADQWLATANLTPEQLEKVNAPPAQPGEFGF